MLISNELDQNPYQAPDSAILSALDLDFQSSDDGVHCPVCRRDITVWSVVRASMPDQIRCPHCHSRLEYTQAEMVWSVVIVILLGLLVLLGYGLSWMTTSPPAVVLLLFGIGAVWLPVEVSAAHYLRRHRRLKTVPARSTPAGPD